MTDLMPRAAGEEPHAVPDDHLAHVADSTPVVHKAGERKHLVRNILTWILRTLLALVFGLPLCSDRLQLNPPWADFSD